MSKRFKAVQKLEAYSEWRKSFERIVDLGTETDPGAEKLQMYFRFASNYTEAIRCLY
jgi:hypothetical protein